MNPKYNPLFEPFTFPNGGTIPNRVLMAPMTTNSSFENGMVTGDELRYYARRSQGLGAVITSCAHVLENGRFAGSPSAASDKRIESLAKLARTIQGNGAKAILQIFHVGRMGSRRALRGEQTVSASAVAPLREGAETPRELTAAEVEEVIHAFGEATRRAILAGFDGVELHGANTYLIQQFFSPHSNRREDEWGGSLEKRLRFPLAVVAAAQQAVKEHADKPFILGYRLSPEEVEEPGITLDDTLVLLDRLKSTGLDYLHISTGSYKQPSLRNKQDKTPILEPIVQAVGNEIPLIGVGAIHTPGDAAAAMEMGLPLVAIGRQLLVEPDWVQKVQEGREGEIRMAIRAEDREDIAFPDEMWEYVKSRPGWVPFA